MISYKRPQICKGSLSQSPKCAKISKLNAKIIIWGTNFTKFNSMDNQTGKSKVIQWDYSNFKTQNFQSVISNDNRWNFKQRGGKLEG